MKKIVMVLMLVSSPALAYSDMCTIDEKIDVASLEPIVQSQSGKSASVVDRYLLNETKPLHLIDGIFNVPGVVTKDITGLGSIRIRGARSFDTKYLYDGFPLKDPSNPQGSFGSFFGDTLTFGNSEIEILRGSASTLYGSEAIGGVVDIVPITLDKVSFRSEYGSRGSILESFDSEPISVSYADSPDFTTKDLRVSHQLGDFKPFLIYQNTEAPLHNAPIVDGILIHDSRDENDKREQHYIQTGVKFDKEPFIVKLSYSDLNRRFEFLPNSDGSGFWNDGSFGGQTLFLDTQVKVLGGVLGYSYQRDFMEISTKLADPEKDRTDLFENDFYAERPFNIGKLHLLLGAREAIHEVAKDRVTYDISATYPFDWFLLRSHYGTGYRSPSLYELYGAFLTSFGRFEVGNPKLSPERSQSFDMGVEKTWDENVSIGTNFFWHTLVNRIDFMGVGYQNIDGTLNTYGWEAFYEKFLWGCSSLRLSYTKTIQPALTDISSNNFEASFKVHKRKWQVIVHGGYRDAHEIVVFDEATFAIDRLSEKGYIYSGITTSYLITKNLSAYSRIDNLFSQTYYDGGYRKNGLEAFGGIKCTW